VTKGALGKDFSPLSYEPSELPRLPALNRCKHVVERGVSIKASVRTIALPEGHADTADQKRVFLRQVLDRVTSLPGVTSAAETVLVPPYEGWQSGLTVAGKPGFEKLTSFFDMCSEGYFQHLGSIGAWQAAIQERRRFGAASGGR